MHRCLEIGTLALGTARPNPNVGCVIVHENKIIGEGYTSPYGGPHAEVNAIASVKDKSLLRQSTLYVSLEPCSHHGKTPPCANHIIESGIRQVIIGCIDPNPDVSGQGIAILEQAGCHVETGILDLECRHHHRRFICFHEKQRPYIILKWAQSRDGILAPDSRNKIGPVWISNRRSRQLVHKWRSEEQAILVGFNTVKHDNPGLNTRNWSGNDPIKVVIDQYNGLGKDYNIFKGKAPIVLSEDHIDFSANIASQIGEHLYKLGINSVIIEGGAKTLGYFIDLNFWDEARVFTGQVELEDGMPAPKLNADPFEQMTIDGDILKIYQNA